MQKNSMIDYWATLLFRTVGPLVRLLPIRAALFLGRALGDLFFIFDLKHRCRAYAHIKTAFGQEMAPAQLRRLTRRFYRAFGQNIIEILFVPRIDKAYVDRYVSIDGLEHVHQAFARGKGVIYVTVHAGSWELANIVNANLGFVFNQFVRQQRMPRLEKVLNEYRSARGAKLIQRENELRTLLQVLKANESVAMTIDQGGSSGMLVDFFGQTASMASGAVRLALKYGCALVPVFLYRQRGPHIKFVVEPALELQQSNDGEADLRANLQALVQIFERFIRAHPHEYLWTYRSWKYSDQRTILILSDGKAGHLRQSQALARIAAGIFAEKGIRAQTLIREVVFKKPYGKTAMFLSGCLSGKYICQGCQLCLRSFLERASYDGLALRKADLIISCGSALVPVNYQLSREHQARSIVIMRPSFWSVRRFDLVVMPRHDRPPDSPRVVAVDTALNLIDAAYLKEQEAEFSQATGILPGAYIGMLVGGDAGDFRLSAQLMLSVIRQAQAAADALGAKLLVTTSRRTDPRIEDMLRQQLGADQRTRSLIIANEKNLASAVGGILSLSRVAVVSPESISMVSEAVASRKQVVVFDGPGLGRRHRRFLGNLSDKGLIRLASPSSLSAAIGACWQGPAQSAVPDDSLAIRARLQKIL